MYGKSVFGSSPTPVHPPRLAPAPENATRSNKRSEMEGEDGEEDACDPATEEPDRTRQREDLGEPQASLAAAFDAAEEDTCEVALEV